jgi:hypothetical protein
MSERIEFAGNPLPAGLPGFGGGTVSVLILPGFNTVVAVQQFGPVVDAPTVTPPDPEPPAGSNPENPTPTPVTPAPAPTPAPPNPPTPIFCKECVSQNNVGNPLMYGVKNSDSCVDCNGNVKTVNRYFSELTASSENAGVFYGDTAEITGKFDGDTWSANTVRLKIENGTSSAELLVDELSFSDDGKITVYARGPKITGDDGKIYEPQDLEVCDGNTTKTWKVLAYKPD